MALRFKQHIQPLLSAIIIVGVSLGLIELGLRLIDPWGLRYFNDVNHMGNTMFVLDDERGYTLVDGIHQFSHWQAQVKDERRVVPDRYNAQCSLAFLGDSITFGAGVDDPQTWVNLIAQDIPDAEVLNYGVPRYNSQNVLGTRQSAVDHDAYIYTVFNNDSEPAYDPSQDQLLAGYGQPWIVLYTQLALRRTAPPAPIDTTRFFNDLDALLNTGRVSLVAFDDDVLTDAIIEREYDVYTVSFPPHPISVADFHLNPQGNEELAASLRPFVDDVIEAACGK